MIAIVQRVSRASVEVGGRVVGQIERGLLVLASVEQDDVQKDLDWTAAKLVSLRIFPSEDNAKAFDRDVREIGGAILLVSNFTVAAACEKGRRPSFDGAAAPASARGMFDQFIAAVASTGVRVETGVFGADMAVALVNDGPAMFVVQSPPRDKGARRIEPHGTP